MRQVRQIMGMPITIDIPGCDDRTVFDSAFERFRRIDERFSTYKEESEVSRYRRGELEEKNLSAGLKRVIKACRAAEKWTDGYFSAWAAGAFDPSGYVKGWAVAQAGRIIEKQEFGTFCISAGGDILARSDSKKVWHIGVQDPLDKSKILNPSTTLWAGKLAIKNGAVCTSGNYEHGAHIINPKTGRPADELLSVTVSGPDIIKADILATACFAMGPKASKFMKSQTNYQVLIVSRRSRGSSR